MKGVWDVKLEIMTDRPTDRPTDEHGHFYAWKPHLPKDSISEMQQPVVTILAPSPIYLKKKNTIITIHYWYLI